MILAHKIALDATVKQRHYFGCAAGCDRFVWNLALAEWNRLYAAGEKPKASEIKKAFNEFKYDAFPWLNDIHRDAHADAFERLGNAWSQYFKRLKEWSGKTKKEKSRRAGLSNQHLSKKRDAAHLGRPNFHKKGRKESFYAANDKLSVERLPNGRGVIRLPVIGRIRMREALRFDGKIAGATVSRHGDRWFVSVQVDVGEKYAKKRTDHGVAGVDLGVKTAATVARREGDNEAMANFDGIARVAIEKFDAPKPLKAGLRKLRRLNRLLSRRTKGGRNWKKMSRRISRLHAKVADIRKDFWHKITTKLCRENQAIAVESLNVAGILKNKRLARSISDVAFYLPKGQLGYKTVIYGSKLAEADRWYASSKTCNNCGCVKESLSLSERVFHCDQCGHEQDRDDNAALNLLVIAEEQCNYPRLAGKSRLGRGRPVRNLVEPGTKQCSLVSTN